MMRRRRQVIAGRWRLTAGCYRPARWLFLRNRRAGETPDGRRQVVVDGGSFPPRSSNIFKELKT